MSPSLPGDPDVASPDDWLAALLVDLGAANGAIERSNARAAACADGLRGQGRAPIAETPGS